MDVLSVAGGAIDDASRKRAQIVPLPTTSNPLRTPSIVLPPSPAASSFLITRSNKSYKHQYANIYFVRLRALRVFVEQRAHRRWREVEGNPILVPRVLEVIKSRLCYIIGTVYMDMPLKPNVMQDIARDHSIPPPPPLPKYNSPDDRIMLEDESGRIRLVGDHVKKARLVTGVIIGALGAETANGDFEVVDVCYPGMAPQPVSEPEVAGREDKMEVDDQSPTSSSSEWIAVVSGLDIGSPSPSDAKTQMLVEYLTGEEGGVKEQVSAAQISRLIIAGNSLTDALPTGRGEIGDAEQRGKARRHGNEGVTFSPHPILNLSARLYDIASAMPIHILPGETDPSGVIMPQQPLPRAMFGAVAKLSTFCVETNPTYLRFACGLQADSETSECAVVRTLLVNSGQPLNDIFKYLPSHRNTRLSILESTLRWRHVAPTAPDTLWCHPYFNGDPFIITETPDLYIVGNQERFATKLVVEGDEHEGVRIRCRIVMVPDFARTGKLILVNLRSLEVKTVTFAIEGMTGGGDEVNLPSARPPSPLPVEPMLTDPRFSGSHESGLF